jgi:uncharacterized membrane protein/thiol-disulfide isomerase/thioredoxin
MLHRSSHLRFALLFACCLSILHPTYLVQAEDVAVHAVLFYSPSCPHCHTVIKEVLPPLFEQYGDQLQIVGVDTSSPGGSALFGAAIQRFAIPPDRQAVPMLIVGETVLLGSIEIPEKFPKLIEQYLAQGGIDWPDIPGLVEALATAQPESHNPPTPTTSPEATTQYEVMASVTPRPETSVAQETVSQTSPTATPPGLILSSDSDLGFKERLVRDPLANSLAIVVLFGMLLMIAGSFHRIRLRVSLTQPVRPSSWIPVLSLVGIAVAGYLAYVETAQVEAVCGPVGDCNTVQQSEYARLFGVLPIGILGLAGYIAILVAWLLGRHGPKRFLPTASLALVGMSLFGVLFSIYLTFLEPFVIGATCAWCLTSAVIITLLFWLSLPPEKSALFT